jgi:queuosine precursor transporter
MIHNIVKDRSTRLFIILGGFFITNALIAEVIGVKIFSFEKTFGLEPLQIKFFGETLSLNLTAGVLLWPVVFIMTDIINEYYGRKGVKLLSYLTAGLIAYAFMMFYGAMGLQPADFFVVSKAGSGITDMEVAYDSVLGQGGWIIIGSLIAFLIGQIVDAYAFYRIKKVTGEKKIWLRATGSTLISQFIDSYVVLFVAFYIGTRVQAKEGDFIWSFQLFLAVGTLNYIYKAIVAIVLTPVLYLIHNVVEKYLGKKLAHEMKESALKQSEPYTNVPSAG